jgi:hypothetical protein
MALLGFPIGSARHLYALFTYTLDFISDLTIQSSHLNQNLGQKVQTGLRKAHQTSPSRFVRCRYRAGFGQTAPATWTDPLDLDDHGELSPISELANRLSANTLSLELRRSRP